MSTHTGDDVWAETFEGPDDNDGRDAASVEVGFEALADRTRYVYNRRIAAIYQIGYDNEASGLNSIVVTTSYQDFAPAGDDLFYIDVPNVVANDVISFDCSTVLSFAVDGSDDQAFFRVVARAPDLSTVVPTGAGIYNELPPGVTVGMRFPVAISSSIVAAQSGTYRVKTQGKTANGGAGDLSIMHAFSLRVLHLKRTP